FFFFQAEDGIRDATVTGVQTCALPISIRLRRSPDRAKGHACPPPREPRWLRCTLAPAFAAATEKVGPRCLYVRGPAPGCTWDEPGSGECPSCDGQLSSEAAVRNAPAASAHARASCRWKTARFVIQVVAQRSETLRMPVGGFHGRGRDRHRIRSGGRAPRGAAREFGTADGAGGAVTHVPHLPQLRLQA